MPSWAHFVPWHWLLWLSLPFALIACGWYFATAATAALLKKVPLSAWLLIAVIVAGSLYHVAAVASAADGAAKAEAAKLAAQIDAANLRATQAEAANQNTAVTIAQLQTSQAQCEAGRLADQTSAARAIAGHDQAATLIHAQLVAEKAAVQALFDKKKNAECANWATQAACTP